MIYLKFAADMDALFGDAAAALRNAWKDPFNSPVILFPESKVEQWFRLRALRKDAPFQDVLANLETVSLDKFLWKSLKPAENEKRLSAEMLQNVIEAWLVSKDASGSENLYSLGAAVSGFLTGSKTETDRSSVDAAKLFDFSNTLAGLFMEYETSRPAGFLNFADSDKFKPDGILAYWKQGNLRDFFSTGKKTLEKEQWQKTLYSRIFHTDADGTSVLSRAFRKAGDGTVEYLTLPYLFAKNKANLKDLQEKKIFFFGLSGMGQFYRVIIQEMSKYAEIHAYIQNPCAEFWEDVQPRVRNEWRWEKKNAPAKIAWVADNDDGSEAGLADNENALLRDWGRSGRENIRLWCLAADYAFEFKGNDPGNDTLLHSVQSAIFRRLGKPEASALNDGSLTLTAAPTRLREVESLHTKVCKLLENGARLDEILVLSPVLDDYRVAIEQVFNHVPHDSPFYIPYTIADSPEKESFTASALNILLRIRSEKNLSRPDFFDLVKNPVVQAVRGITPSQVADWETWVSDMNVYRDVSDSDGKKSPHGWTFGVRRMVLARLMDRPYDLGEDTYHPYSDLESGNDAGLGKFLACIDSLEKWASAGDSVSESSIADTENFLNEWLNSRLNFLESKAVRTMLDALQNLRWQFRAGRADVNFSEAAFALGSALGNIKTGNGNLFTGGLSFMKLAMNRSLPIRYAFILGMGAKEFPGSNPENTLDLRLFAARWPGDDRTIDKNRYTFLCQLVNAKDGLFLSYVNKNLQKDEDLVCSGIVRDLQNFIALSDKASGANFTEEIVPLDETRPWNELYTKRALRGKRQNAAVPEDKTEPDGFRETEFPDSGKMSSAPDKIPERIYGWQLKKFLQNPFEFQVTEALDLPEDEADATIDAFEPVAVDGLQLHSLNRELFAELGKKIGQTGLNDEEVHALFKDLRAKGDLPDALFGRAAEAQAKKILDAQISNFNACGLDFRKFEAKASFQYQYGTSTLTAESDWSQKVSDSEWQLFNVCSGKARTDHYLQSFICSLAIAAQASHEVHFTLYVIPGVAQKDPVKPKTYSISPEDGRKRLNEIIKLCFVDHYRKLVPLNFVADTDVTLANMELDDYIEEYWKNAFSAREYFGDEELGFVDNEHFISEVQTARDLLQKLLNELLDDSETTENAPSAKTKTKKNRPAVKGAEK
ncbi:MAG: exodeoxyribonuclease V subunit gamma [Fibrobacteraceae bacterium]